MRAGGRPTLPFGSAMQANLYERTRQLTENKSLLFLKQAKSAKLLKINYLLEICGQNIDNKWLVVKKAGKVPRAPRVSFSEPPGGFHCG